MATTTTDSFSRRRWISSSSVMDIRTLLYLSVVCLWLGVAGQKQSGSCYDPNGRPQRCMPEFGNAAYKLPVDATNTCGTPPIRYCLQTGATGATQSCSWCDANDPKLRHFPAHLTDQNDNQTSWWQSETMNEGMQYPSRVNLTLNLGKSFEITYVRLKFHSKRPESFAIYKRTTEESDWVPWQYYSASCGRTYGVPFEEIIRPHNEQLAICTADYSDISPLTGGNVAFSTLEGRPGGYRFETSEALQDWVTATSVRIVLTRMNTFGDEVFGDETVLQSYFYAISDLSVGGRCKCNGHASECVRSVVRGNNRLVCRCEHKTAGPDCDECLPFYNDRPWSRATSVEANECMACDCNGLSNRCYFDRRLYERTGRGGHCTNCTDNADGPHCENCLPNYYRKQPENRCLDCQCNPTGSSSLQCDALGRCPCKPGVTGDKCDACMPNHYDFGPTGCRPCQCLVAGSENNDPRCLPNSGICSCKEYVEGQNCDKCKPSYFGLGEDNPQGCISCFCYGHSSVCQSAPGYVKKEIIAMFERGEEGWSVVDSESNERIADWTSGAISARAENENKVYFSAPSRFLGDQKSSYNLLITFKLRIDADGSRPSRTDLILISGNSEVSLPIFAQRNLVPKPVYEMYSFRLNEHQSYQWTPRLDAVSFIGILANLTGIKIRASYTPDGQGVLDEFKLETAGRRHNGGDETTNVEKCTCPTGYVGQFCESCASGYHRDPPYGGPYARCVPCNCNGHAQTCDTNSGRCICQDNTMGDNCEMCASGYYGDPLKGTTSDCQPCPCPDRSACIELGNGDVVCTECKKGYGGARCDKCVDGYHGDPEGKMTSRRQPCQECRCNENIDPNAIFNCNGTSGECLKCIYNTGGFSCDKCRAGYYGDPLKYPRGDCKACACHPPGTYENSDGVMQCDMERGQCPCKPNVAAKQCDKCEPGYWGLSTGRGCRSCDCDIQGSHNNTCDLQTGQCFCKPGVTGKKCDKCLPSYYGFSREGCKACNCDPEGSRNLQCDDSGQCPCNTNIVGKQCDSCEENKFNISAGCVACPACYDLILDRVNIHRRKLRELRDLIQNIGNNPQEIDDSDFRNKLAEVNTTVHDLWVDAMNSDGGESTIAEEIRKIREAIDDLNDKCSELETKINMADDNVVDAKDDIKDTLSRLDRATQLLDRAENHINNEGRDALRRAKEAQLKSDQQSSRMTEIAKLARELSIGQKDQSEMIDSTANNAKDTSTEAYELAKKVLQQPNDTLSKLMEIQKNLTGASDLYNQTVRYAKYAADNATESYTEALDMYSQADSLQLPDIDTDMLKDKAKNITDRAHTIKRDANDLTSENRQLLIDVDKQKMEGEDLLKQAIEAQQVTDELLADVDVAKTIAMDAVASGEKTLKEANETLRILQEFDRRVKESKAKAEDALKDIPEIEDKIKTAEDKTAAAQISLAGAESDASMALNDAMEAKRIAEKAAMDASYVKDDATVAKNRSITERERAERLHGSTYDYLDEIIKLEKQADADEIMINDANDKAEEAKRQAAITQSKVQTALEAINQIIIDLDAQVVVDANRLSDLEKTFTEVEQLVIDSQLEQRYDGIIDIRERQRKTLESFDLDLNLLRQDVSNIQDIREKLPTGCFKELDLEKTEP